MDKDDKDEISKEIREYKNSTKSPTNVQPGILMPIKDHRTSAQLPSPFIASIKTSKTGKVSKRYSISGPQVGTSSSGRF